MRAFTVSTKHVPSGEGRSFWVGDKEFVTLKLTSEEPFTAPPQAVSPTRFPDGHHIYFLHPYGNNLTSCLARVRF
jgi:hypothetical protein